MTGWLRYVVTVGVLTLPILAWNVVCTRYLPEPLRSSAFNRDIPPLVLFSENTLRIAVMLPPFLMPLDVTTTLQGRGIWPFVAGALIYPIRHQPTQYSANAARYPLDAIPAKRTSAVAVWRNSVGKISALAAKVA